MKTEKGLIFGVHPFGMSGMAEGVATGAPDDFNKIGQAILELKGDAEDFVIRSYVHYYGAESAEDVLAQIGQFLQVDVQWDIVLGFRYEGMELDGWLKLIRDIIEKYGSRLYTLQITGEANLLNMPGSGDGYCPNVRQALVQGMIAARKAIKKHGASTNIGFGVAVNFQPGNDFWEDIGRIGGEEFGAALDYVGFDFYPDVFWRIPLENIPAGIKTALESFRQKDLKIGNISETVPIRITENGWPTNSERSYNMQAKVLESVIRTIYDLREEFNITHYELFSLRDADSSNDNFFYQFGILRDDYTPKPAFEVYKHLIRELS